MNNLHLSNSLRRIAACFFLSCTSGFAVEPPVIGYTEPYRIITVSAAETGVIAELPVKEGDIVKAGQVLAKLNNEVFAAELEIAQAEASLAATRNERITELSRTGKSTPEEVERARTEQAIKNAQVRRISAQIENRTMRSPVDGIVTEIKRDPSEAVSPTQPQVLTVVQIDKLVVNFFLPPARASKLKAGASATLDLLDTPGKLAATVEFVSPVTDAASGTVRVKFVIENADGEHRAGSRCTLVDDAR
ncbi:MAG: efflux RND transporter periplasmic adaptor subunit [Chthoniobacteraceae bacterium]